MIILDIDPNEVSNFSGQEYDTIFSYQKTTCVRLSCFAHTIQLCVRDGLKNELQVARVLEKCRLLAKYSNESIKLTDLLDDLHKHINKANVTRWNSEYLLIKSILKIESKELELISKSIDDSIIFLNSDFILMQEIVDVLEPFYEISLKCQSERIVTVSIVVPAIVHLISYLRAMKNAVTSIPKLVQELLSSIEKRFSGIIHRLNLESVDTNEPFSDPVYFMAAVLDPSFKFFWIQDLKLSINDENCLKQSIIQQILIHIGNDSDKNRNFETEFSNTTITNTTTSIDEIKKKKLFVYHTTKDHTNSMVRPDPSSELDNYLNDPLRSEFSDFWIKSRLNVLKGFVKKIFSVQASSAPVERVFSHAGLILSSRRTNMNEQLFKNLVFLKVNQSLL